MRCHEIWSMALSYHRLLEMYLLFTNSAYSAAVVSPAHQIADVCSTYNVCPVKIK